MNVTTVLGEVSCLGFFHSHEHLFIKNGKPAQVDSSLILEDYEKTKNELLDFKGEGGSGLIDCQPVGCGRMADKLEKISLETGMNIIAVTGFHKSNFYNNGHWILEGSEREITNIFLEELTNGMYLDGESSFPKDRCTARAGAIKTASDKNGITGVYKKLFECAANAAITVGAPVISHTEMGECAIQQAEFFIKRRVPARSVIICHTDRIIRELPYYKELLDMGVYLEFDTIGRHKYHSDYDEAALVLKLVEEGYEDSILLGLDVTNKRMKSYCGEIGLTYIINSFIPLLLEHGLLQEHVNKFTVSNPSTAFSKNTNI